MKRMTFFFSIIYALLAILNVFSHFAGISIWHIVTKPLLMPSLILILWIETGLKSVFVKMILWALIFSWAGDITLMKSEYFIFGLIFFLLAHIFYSIGILMIKGSKGILQFQPLFALPIAVYLILLLSLLNNFLDKLKIPVFMYGIVICTVWMLTMNLFWKTDKKIASLFFFASFQFVLSDSLLAVNHFVYPHYILSALIMATYCSAQYLFILGSISYNKILI
ncbi:MAG: lysoplasmalogenase [Bacteroidetes bacterium]|nr:lysoplasmalogenase [Bacteroidota bacterium]